MASRKILLSVDDSDESRYATDYALKNICTSVDKLIILHCYAEPITLYPAMSHGWVSHPEWIDRLQAETLADSKKLTEEIAGKAQAAQIPYEVVTRAGDARDVVVNTARELGCDLLVVGCRGLGLVKGLFLGSVSHYCLHHAKCPVMIIRRPKWDGDHQKGANGKAEEKATAAPEGDKKRTVVLALDGSQSSKNAYRWALNNFVTPGNDRLVLIIAESLPPCLGYAEFVTASMEAKMERDLLAADKRILETLATEAKAKGFQCSTDVVQGDARDALPWATRKFSADVLVMGSRGRGPVKSLLLGSVSAHCAQHVDCPVLIVRPSS